MFTGESHTSEYLCELLHGKIEEAETTLGVKIVCVATDNASNFKAMRELMAAKRPSVVYVGCQAHWANLLLKDMAGDSAALNKIVVILKWVLDHGPALAELKAKVFFIPF